MSFLLFLYLVTILRFSFSFKLLNSHDSGNIFVLNFLSPTHDTTVPAIIVLGVSTVALSSSLRFATNILSLADWRNVNIGNNERKLTKSSVNATSTWLRSHPVSTESEKSNLMTELAIEEANLQNEMHVIEALELRNEAQIESFVDAYSQWKAQSREDQIMLKRKLYVERRLDIIRALTSKVQMKT